MNKKSISVISLTLILFLCFQFPVFAVTSGGSTVTSSSYSYNDGDVTLYTRVNGHLAEPSETTVGTGNYTYEYAYTVVLANKTNDFQVASTNAFTVDLFTGYTDTFSASTTNTPDGSSMYRPSWGYEVISYSDNMSAPRILVYSSGDYSGHVLVSFTDSDLLVLNPNETRTYTFTIHFTQTITVNTYPINGNPMYSYFTYYNSNVSFYQRPNSFTANTINDFIANDSLPNSVIAYLMAQYDLLYEAPSVQDYLDNFPSGLSQHQAYKNYSRATSLYEEYVRYYTSGFRIISTDYDIYNVVNGENSGSRDIVGAIDCYVTYTLRSTGEHDVLVNPANVTIDYYPTFNLNGWHHLGAEFVQVSSNGFNLINVLPYATGTQQYILLQPVETTHDQGVARVATKQPTFCTVKITYYFGISDTTLADITTAPDFSNLSTSNIGTRYNNHTEQTYTTHSIIWYLRNWWASYTTNQPQADDVTDDATDVTSDIENQHQQEATYYSDTNTAIDSSGLDTYTLDSNTTSGLNGLKTDFTLVWNACGTLSNVWILSLTLSLALYIIRHRRMFKV